jgi:hypothetical protein
MRLPLLMGDFFAARFLSGFFLLPLDLAEDVEGFTTAMSFVPMGVPRPVQASQPGPAVKPVGEPE